MTRRTLIIIALALIVCLSAPAVAVYWLCYTEPGLQWLAARVSGMPKVNMQFHGLTGVLRGPLHVDRFELDQERVHIVATDVRADVRLRRILLQTIDADYLEAADIEITLKPRVSPQSATPPHFLPSWLRVNAHRVSVARSELILISGRALEASRIQASAIMTAERLRVRKAAATSGDLSVSGDASLHATQPLRLAGRVAWKYAPADQPAWAGKVAARGDLDRLTAHGSVAEPMIATFAGSLLDLTHDWHWEASLGISNFTLKPWSPDSPVSVPSATLAGHGAGQELHLSGSLHPGFPETGPLDIKLDGSFSGRTLHASDLQVLLKATSGELRAAGDIGFHGGWPELHLAGEWTQLAYPFVGKPLIRSKRGEFTLAGEVPYRYTTTADVAGFDRTAAISSRGLFERDAITWEDLHARILDGDILAKGSLRFGDKAPWTVNANVDKIDVAQIDADFPGRIGFQLDASGRGFDRAAALELRMSDLRGRLRNQPISGRSHLRYSDETIKVDDTDLKFGDARLQAHGDYGAQPTLSWDLNIPDFAQLHPDAHGSLASQGALSGTRAAPRVGGTMSARDFSFGDYRVARLEAKGQVDLADRIASQLQASASDLKWGKYQLHAVDVAIDGRASANQISIKADAEEASLAVRAQSSYADGTLSGVIDRFDLGIGETPLKLANPARFSVSRTHGELAQLCLNSTSEQACARGDWSSDGRWSLNLDAGGLPLKILAAGLPRPSEYSGVLSLHANASAEPGKAWTGEAQVKLADGVFSYKRPNGKTESIEVGVGEANLSAVAERIHGEVHLAATQAAGLTASVTANRQGISDWHAMPLSGEAHAETRELAFLPIFVPEIDRASGHLTSDVKLGGTLGTPEINGTLLIEDGALDVYTTNLQLRDLKARVELRGNGLTLAASVRAGDGTASLDGGLEWRDRAPHGSFKFKGTNLELVNVPEAQVRVSPDLRFRIEGRDIGVDGAVRIPKAMLAPADLSKATLASSDEVIVGTEEQNREAKGFRVTAGLLLALGNDVRVNAYGLKARVEGSITASAAPDEVSTAIGELKIAEDSGKYSAYTRELDIEQGRLIFSGGPVSDPGVDLRASKEFPDAKVGVNVRGTLRNPRLTFWSDPVLPQTQIASLILTGGKLEDAQTPGGAPTAPGARTQLLAQGSALLASQLGQQLGLNLEEVRVEADSNDTTRLVLGRYLSPRFYVSYGISFTEALNTLKLRYTINDKWTIKSEAGENRSLDLEFKIER
ncbi:MAG TPA: translocation/assembly module TamB domain-containing protein [Steroidobacteraceae bacterium]